MTDAQPSRVRPAVDAVGEQDVDLVVLVPAAALQLGESDTPRSAGARGGRCGLPWAGGPRPPAGAATRNRNRRAATARSGADSRATPRASAGDSGGARLYATAGAGSRTRSTGATVKPEGRSAVVVEPSAPSSQAWKPGGALREYARGRSMPRPRALRRVNARRTSVSSAPVSAPWGRARAPAG